MANGLLVGVDVGCHQHEVVVSDQEGILLDHFQIDHKAQGLDQFFDRIDLHQTHTDTPVRVAMEGFNGWARPLDQLVMDRGWQLFNVNNLKLARYKEIFPAPAKTDAIDAKRIVELFAFEGQKHVARDVLQAIPTISSAHKALKYLTRRRRQRVEERALRQTRLRVDLQAYSPGLMAVTTTVDRLWFLNFLTTRDDIRQLATLRDKTVLSIKGVGKVYAKRIKDWQQHASFSPSIEMASHDIVADAKALQTLIQEIDELDQRIAEQRQHSRDAQILQSIPGFGDTSVAELTAEIGTIERFQSESSFAYYLGMAPLDKSSGLVKRSKRSININKQCQYALMTCIARHKACVPQSETYYQKKRKQGKTHNQAIRALGRHLARVMWKMLTHHRDYVLPTQKNEKPT